MVFPCISGKDAFLHLSLSLYSIPKCSHTSISYFSIFSYNCYSFIFRGPLEGINYGYRGLSLLRSGVSHRAENEGHPTTARRPLPQWEMFQNLLSLMPLFASDIFKDTVLIGPRDTFCVFYLRKSTGKTVLLRPTFFRSRSLLIVVYKDDWD